VVGSLEQRTRDCCEASHIYFSPLPTRRTGVSTTLLANLMWLFMQKSHVWRRNFIAKKLEFHKNEDYYCRSQWPRGLSHELSSTARTLGSWVRIPRKAWMSVCFFLRLCCPVCRQRPCNGLITRRRSPTDCVKWITKLKKRPGPNKGL
jgi:hypothetical protein